MDQIWQQIRGELQKSLTKGQYDLWVSTLDFLGAKEETLLIGCRNKLHVGWVREKLEKRLLPVAEKFLPGIRSVEYIISADGPLEESRKEEVDLEIPRQASFGEIIKRPGALFNPRFTFDQFVVGSCNQFAYAAAMGVAGGRELNNNSLYIVSETGLGKSHLSHAVGNFLCSHKPGARVRYLTAEQFTNEMVASLKTQRIETFKEKYREDCDVLLLERVEFLSGKEKVQTELLYTLDELQNRGKCIVCTGNAQPRDIPKLSSDLQSRLGGILVAQIDPPDFLTRVQIIKHKLRKENVQAPSQVIEFLAERFTGDIRSLESCLVGLMAKSNIFRIPITLQLAREVTDTMMSHLPKLTVERIQQMVCSSFQITVQDLSSPSRRKELALARKIGMFLCRQYTTESLATIGKAFSRSHSTVVYAVSELAKQMKDGKGKIKREVDYISHRLETSCLYG